MTFCLIRFEICSTSRKLSYIPPGDGPCHTKAKNATLADKEKLVRECHERLESNYLVYCEDAGPLFWVAATVARLIVAKMGLIIYLGTPGVADNLSQDVKDRLFIAAIEIMEYSRLLETEGTTKKWGWLFHTYVQWHAIAYILNQIGARPNSELVERAYRCVAIVFREWDDAMKRSKNGTLWIPMRKLMVKVTQKRERDRQLASRASSENQTTSEFEQFPSASGSMSPDPPLDPIRPLQQAPTATGAALEQHMGSGLSQFYNQQFGQNDIATELEMQYQHIIDHSSSSAPWILPDTGVSTDIGMDGTADASWENFDNLVRDFQMEVDVSQPDVRGPIVGGSWW
jgi:hypothetical protein